MCFDLVTTHLRCIATRLDPPLVSVDDDCEHPLDLHLELLGKLCGVVSYIRQTIPHAVIRAAFLPYLSVEVCQLLFPACRLDRLGHNSASVCLIVGTDRTERREINGNHSTDHADS